MFLRRNPVNFLASTLRRSGTAVALGLSVTAQLVAESDQEKSRAPLPLPQWSRPGETVDPDFPPRLGGGLWPDDFNADEIIHPAIVSPSDQEMAQSAVSEQDSWLRFLPRGLFSGKRADAPPAEPPPVEISSEVWRACENAPGSTRLVDPQGLMTEAQTEDLSRLLAFHAERAAVTACVLLIDRFQKLPADADLAKLASGEFARGSSCIVVYPLGAPARARLLLTQSVSQAADPAYFQTIASACIRDALETPDPVEQLQRYATQLSIRLFWLERAYPVLKPKLIEPSAPVAQEPLAIEEPQEPLSEVASVNSPVAAPAENIPPSWERMKFEMLTALGGFVLFVLGIIMLLRWRKRVARRTIWILPDYDHHQPVRFGGQHCGGSGASLHYG
jgi:hypothetical protein